MLEVVKSKLGLVKSNLDLIKPRLDFMILVRLGQVFTGGMRGRERRVNDKDINDLFLKLVDLVTQARERVATAVNVAEVYTKFHIGQYIVEYEQKGETRAEYGKTVLKELSKRLTDRFGEGWSYSTLKNIRQFYIVFAKRPTTGCPNQKANHRLAFCSDADGHLSVMTPAIPDTNKFDNQCLLNSDPAFSLSWSHYLILRRVKK